MKLTWQNKSIRITTITTIVAFMVTAVGYFSNVYDIYKLATEKKIGKFINDNGRLMYRDENGEVRRLYRQGKIKYKNGYYKNHFYFDDEGKRVYVW